MSRENRNAAAMRRASKFISLVLRHHPEAAGIELDEHGWADVDGLIAGIVRTGRQLDKDTLEEIVRTDEKGRYSFNEDHTKIRANQGHSVQVDVDLAEAAPPDVLYHGTAESRLASIMREGLRPMGRLYVHLSQDEATAVKVGRRHGKPAVLQVDARRMAADGHTFWLSANGVWLTRGVPAEYIDILTSPITSRE